MPEVNASYDQPINVQSRDLAILIENFMMICERFEKQNQDLTKTKARMSGAWNNDTQWNEKAERLVRNIIEINEETIQVLDMNNNDLCDWLIRIKGVQDNF